MFSSVVMKDRSLLLVPPFSIKRKSTKESEIAHNTYLYIHIPHIFSSFSLLNSY